MSNHFKQISTIEVKNCCKILQIKQKYNSIHPYKKNINYSKYLGCNANGLNKYLPVIVLSLLSIVIHSHIIVKYGTL